MKNYLLQLSFCFIFLSFGANAQIINQIQVPTSIDETGAPPDPSAILDLYSTDKGLLVPRMSSFQRNNISSPAMGLMVYDTDTNEFMYWDGITGWKTMGGSGGFAPWNNHSFGIYYNAGNVAINSSTVSNKHNLYVYSTLTGADNAAILGFREGGNSASSGGTSWGYFDVDSAVKGHTNWGNNYSAAVYGSSGLDFINSASVMGALTDGTVFGALGFKDNNSNTFAGYFNGNVVVPFDKMAIGTNQIDANSELFVERFIGETGAGKSSIFGFRFGSSSSAAAGGTGWGVDDVDVAVKGESQYGNNYSAGIYGYSDVFWANSAAVMGYTSSSLYGALGYNDGTDKYAGYFQGKVKIIDGTEGAGKVLTSDANGNASWQNAAGGADNDWLTDANGIYHTSGNVAINSLPNPAFDLWVSRGTGDVGGGKANIYASRSGGPLAGNGGSSWSSANVDAAISGYSFNGNNYSAAVYGGSELDFDNSAAVLGAKANGTVYGALGYRHTTGLDYAYYGVGPARFKENGNFGGIYIEDENSTDFWRMTYDTAGDDFEFIYNFSLKAYISDFDGAYSMTSDRSLKTDIEYLGGVLPKLTRLKPAKYFYTDATHAANKSHGFIAQEVQEVFPELVREKNGILTLAYDDFAVIAVQAIKEQQTIIDDLTADKAAQAQKNAELEQRLAKLEALLLEAK